jgi:predicted anti-sigma-YlaC factor YlaD
MTCADAQDLIDAVAAGDAVPDAGLTAHLQGCPRCAAALETGRRLERALGTLPVPAAPVRLSQDVIAAVRRERWRREEHVDRAFNLTIGLAVVLVAVALVSLANLGSLAQILLLAGEALSRTVEQASTAPAGGSLSTIGLTAAVAMTVLAVWWWAERRPGYEEKGLPQ